MEKQTQRVFLRETKLKLSVWKSMEDTLLGVMPAVFVHNGTVYSSGDLLACGRLKLRRSTCSSSSHVDTACPQVFRGMGT